MNVVLSQSKRNPPEIWSAWYGGIPLSVDGQFFEM